jgi:hypothetical protein
VDRIQAAAEISVGRAVGFGALAVGTMVLGLVFDPVLALKTGGALTLLMSVVLRMNSRQAWSRPYRRTEVWLILDRRLEVPEDCAQRMVSQVLHDTYDRYARCCLAVAVGLWLLGLTFQFLA